MILVIYLINSVIGQKLVDKERPAAHFKGPKSVKLEVGRKLQLEVIGTKK